MAKPIKQKNVGPSTDIPWASAISVNNSSGVDITANQIVYISGRSGLHMKITLADADTPLASIGNLYVANHDIASGTTSASYGYILPWKVIIGVDTSAALGAGSAVYLSGTAGGWTTTPGASKIRIGTVLEDHAVSGAVLLAPGSSNADSGGAGLQIADVVNGAIPVTNSGTVAIATTGAETNAVADPTFLGQRLILTMDVDGGNRVVTFASDINIAGNNVATFSAVRQTLVLEAIRLAGVLEWELVANNGSVVLSG